MVSKKVTRASQIKCTVEPSLSEQPRPKSVRILEFPAKISMFSGDKSIYSSKMVIVEVHILKTIKISGPQLIHSDEFRLESQLADPDL